MFCTQKMHIDNSTQFVKEREVHRTDTIVITRERTWLLTALSVLVFVLLSWVFADGLFVGPLWNAEDWPSSPIITYLLIGLIILCGAIQARYLGSGQYLLRSRVLPDTPGAVEDPSLWYLLMSNVHLSLLWLPVRFFVGRDWLTHGWEKIGNPAWVDGGEALRGYWERAVTIPEEGRPPISYHWYRDFLQGLLDREAYSWFAPLVAWGEVLVGLGLLVGALVGIAALFGTLMNFSFMLAGTASTNPVLFALGVLLILAWKVAGFWGLDRWLLPALGTPWRHDPTRAAPSPAYVTG